MSNADFRGQFVWHELMTTDTGGAGGFYPKVVGWGSQQWDKDTSYTMWTAKGGPLGGYMRLPDAATASGAGSHWLPYIRTSDIKGTVASTQRLGGKVVKDVTDIPNMGQYAVLTDPQGAMFAVHSSTEQPGNSGVPNEPGQFSWHELGTTDYAAAMSFYKELFGWEKGPAHDMGPAGMYQLFLQGGKQIGGIYNSDPAKSPPAWLCYVRVADAGKAVNAAKAAGGMVVNGPMEVPGGDWVAQIVDPQGAMFAVHEIKSAPAAKPKKAKAAAAPQAAKPAEPVKAAAPAKPAAKPAAKKAAAKKAPAKKAAKKAASKKAAAKKAPARKAAAKKKKAAPKRAARKAAAKKGKKKAARKK